jgi:predicted ribonuclease YlaK
MSLTALFIDTNIFLHYQSFDEIDWLGILNVNHVEIRLPDIIVQELDKHKWSTSLRLRDKATKVIKKLHRLADSGLRVSLKSNVDICFEVGREAPNFTALGLDSDSQDDRFLASILLFRDENPSLPIILVAADLGLRLKAKYHQIEAICLSDDLRIPTELDQGEKRIKELELEILELKRRMPDLKLCFSDRSNRLNCKVEKPAALHFDLKKHIEQIKQKYPKMPEIESGKQATDSPDFASRNSQENKIPVKLGQLLYPI